MKMILFVFVATGLLGASSPTASAQVGTANEQAARRACWDQLGIPRNSGPGTKVNELLKCVTKRLGRPDPYLTARYGTAK